MLHRNQDGDRYTSEGISYYTESTNEGCAEDLDDTNIRMSSPSHNRDAEVSDNAIEDRMAKAERLLALKEQAFKDLERSTLEGLL